MPCVYGETMHDPGSVGGMKYEQPGDGTIYINLNRAYQCYRCLGITRILVAFKIAYYCSHFSHVTPYETGYRSQLR
jgi:hypothetical protein